MTESRSRTLATALQRRARPVLRRLVEAALGIALGAVLGAGVSGAAPTTVGAADPSELCEAAIVAAAARRDVPVDLLRAIALVESGRTRGGVRAPWPWTVNMEGVGRWFESREAALDYVRTQQARGARSFDLGCLQVNHFWHGKHFEGVAEMIEPAANVDYAARFLADLKAETGDWMRAAGYYHSRTPEPFARYSKLIAAAYKAETAPRAAPRATVETVVAALAAPARAAETGGAAAPGPAPAFHGLLRLAARTMPGAHAAPGGRPRTAGAAGALPTQGAQPSAPSAGAVALQGPFSARGGPLLRAAARPLVAPRGAPPES